ncbi:MAG: hypothetical protein OXP69_11535, partial [Spirochaetaceae bacterium]|nr:hypothetical protein [Spirochaetaceae bacterium]
MSRGASPPGASPPGASPPGASPPGTQRRAALLPAAFLLFLVAGLAVADVPVATISGPTAVQEGAAAGTPRPVAYTVALGDGLRGSTAIVVDYTVAGTATRDVDYTDAGGGKLTIAAGAASARITINVLHDTIDDVGETLIVTLTGATTNAGMVAMGSPNRVVTTIRSAGTAIVTAADVTAPEADDEGADGEIVFTVTVPAGITDSLEVVYATRDVTATAGADYTAQSGTLTIAGGTTGSVTVATVPLRDDDLWEGDEQFELTMRLVDPPANVALENNVLTGIITDDDALHAEVSSQVGNVVEGSAATFGVELRDDVWPSGRPAASAAAVVVEYEVAGTGITAHDFVDPNAGTVTIPAGEPRASFTITTLVDELLERDELLTVTLMRATTAAGDVGISPGVRTAEVYIGDRGRVVTVDVLETTGREGGNAVFDVRLSGKVSSDVTMDFSFAHGWAIGRRATDPNPVRDYTVPARPPGARHLAIAAGQTSGRMTVELVEDDLAEGDEQFRMLIGGTAHWPRGVESRRGGAWATITDKNILMASIRGPDTVPEGSPAVYSVELAGGVGTADVVVDYTVGGTATAGTDYTDLGEGRLTMAAFPPGRDRRAVRRTASTGSFTIQTRAVDNDAAGETLVVTLTGADAAWGMATVGTPRTATTTFTPASTVTASVSANQREVSEGTAATFAVALTGGTNSEHLVVNYALGGSATAADYTVAPAVRALTFAASTTVRTQTITITPTDDDLEEDRETVTVTVSLAGQPAGASIGTAVAATAIDDGDTLTAAVAADAQTVAEGAGATFTVTLTGATSTAAVTIPYEVRVDGAVSGDVRPSSGVLTIPAGAATGVITVATVDDGLAEPAETLSVRLSKPATRYGRVALGTAAASTTIAASDGGLSVSVSGAGTVKEGSDAVFTIRLSGTVKNDIAVTVTPAAAAATDYDGTPRDVILKAGARSARFTVATMLDNLAEDDETFTVTIASRGNSLSDNSVTLGVATASATIRDDDPLRVNLSGDKAVAAGSAASYTVRLDGGLGSAAVTATWQGGAASGTATIAAGASSATFTVGTGAGDAPGSLSVSLTGAATTAGQVRLGTAAASTRIVAAGTVTVSLAAPAASAEDGTFNFTATTTGTPAGDGVVVRYATATGTASGADFDAARGTLTITSAGATTVPVTVIDDTLAEDSERFSMTLTLVSPRDGSVVLGTDRATATINDNDALTATVTRLRESVLEGTAATFRVALTRTGGASAAGSRPVIVRYRPTAASTARPPADYSSPSGTLTIPAGRSSGTITIRTRADNVLELRDLTGPFRLLGETLAVELTTATTAAGTVTASRTASAETNIRDHDGTVAVSVADAAPVDEGGAAVFRVSFSGPVSYPVTVAVAAAGNTDDYAAPAAALTFAAGETRATVTVQTTDDTFAEDEETFTLTLSNVVVVPTPPTVRMNGTVVLRDSTATGTIRTSDPLRVDLGGPRAVAEDAAASVPYTLTLTGGTTDTGNDITVDYAYRVGAQSGTGTATIAAESLTGTFTVTPADAPSVGDTLVVALTGAAAVRGTVTRGTSSVSTEVVGETLSVNAPTTGEGSAAAFTVTPSGAVYAVLSYRTADGTAGAPADYTAHSGTLTFGSATGTTTTGSSSAQTITVATGSDSLNEGDETFNLHLSWVRGAPGVGIATPAVPGTITDAADDALTASVAAAAATVPEGSAAAFVVTLTGAVSTAPVVVGYEVGGTASVRDGDYTAPSGALTIARGAATGTISIATRDDGVLDRGETLTVTLVSATSAGAVALGTATASITIGDAAEVRVTIGDTTVVEAETAVFTVALSGKVAADVTVDYSTRAGPSGPTGATTADYTAPAAGAALTVTAGETTATIKVATVDDRLAEADETFTVVLDLPDDAPAGVTLGDGYGEATIKDDRPAARLPGAGPGGGAAAGPEGPLAGPESVAEGDAAVYTLEVPAGVAGGEEVTVSFSTEGSTATAGRDFSPDHGSVTIPADAATATAAAFTIQVADDQVVDLRETLVVTATAAVAGGGVLPIGGVARTVIVDPGTVRVSLTADPEIVEERRAAATFTVALTGTVAEALTLPWSTGADGDTATADQDYTAVADAALTIAAQQTTATITVAVTADGQDEADETFTVRLDPGAPAAQVEIATAAAQATITDRAAGAGERSVSVTAPETVAEGGVARFTVWVGGAESSAPVTVSYALGGTAEAPADYTAPSAAMVSIAAGRRTATIAIQTRSDRVLEPDETLVVTLTGAQTTGGPVRVGSPRSAATAIQDPVYHSINRVNRALLPGV